MLITEAYDHTWFKKYDEECNEKYNNEFLMNKLQLRKTHKETADNIVKRIIFNPPATIVFWQDGTKTVVKCQNGEEFDPEKGLAMAIVKHDHELGVFNKLMEKAEYRGVQECAARSFTDVVNDAAEKINALAQTLAANKEE